MKPRHVIVAAALLALPVAAGGDRVVSHPASPASAQGMVLNLDPTVKPGQIAQSTDLHAILGEAVSTSTVGLVEQASPVPGGGVMVDLQGRFQNAVVAERNADGSVRVPCVSGDHAGTEEVK